LLNACIFPDLAGVAPSKAGDPEYHFASSAAATPQGADRDRATSRPLRAKTIRGDRQAATRRCGRGRAALKVHAGGSRYATLPVARLRRGVKSIAKAEKSAPQFVLRESENGCINLDHSFKDCIASCAPVDRDVNDGSIAMCVYVST
jgi:hypothetical protein